MGVLERISNLQRLDMVSTIVKGQFTVVNTIRLRTVNNHTYYENQFILMYMTRNHGNPYGTSSGIMLSRKTFLKTFLLHQNSGQT